MILIGRGLDYKSVILRLIDNSLYTESDTVQSSGCDEIITLTISGGNDEGVPPVPIPNTEVKPFSADGTWLETARESRSPPDSK